MYWSYDFKISQPKSDKYEDHMYIIEELISYQGP